jgi:hypothetical protein
MRLRALVVGLLLLIVSANAGFGYPASTYQLQYALDHSVVAVVGQIERVDPPTPVVRQGLGPGRGYGSPIRLLLRTAVVRADMVLKGDGIAPGTAIHFQFLGEDGQVSTYDLPRFGPGERWLLFLEAVDGQLEPFNPLGSQNLRLPGGYRPSPITYTSPLERSEAVLADVLATEMARRTAPQPRYTESLTDQILDILHSGTQTVLVPAPPGAKSGDPRPHRAGFATLGLVAQLVRLSKSDVDASVRAAAAAILVRTGRSDAVEMLVTAQRDVLWQTGRSDRRWIDALSTVTDPSLLPRLHQLLFDPDPKLREPVASALREIADPSSVPYLLKALDDSDSEVRYFAATGLAAIAKENAHYLAVTLFREHESEQIAYWKARSWAP